MPPADVAAPSPAEAVLTFLESVGRRSEAEFYLKLFRQLPKESFAVIAPSPQVLRQALGSLVEQLRFLYDLDLAAPVVLGLIDPEASTGGAERLSKRLPSVGLEPNVHSADEPGLADRLRQELRGEKVPLVQFSPSPGQTVAERFSKLGELLRGLGTRKIVLLRRKGGIGPKGERRLELGPGHILPAHTGGISVINLRTDREPLLAQKRVRRDDAVLLDEINTLLSDTAMSSLLVNIASPLNLLKELFTVKGAGTLVKAGAAIDRLVSYDDADVPRIRELLESSFAKRLDSGFFERPPLAVYVESSYRGVAILHPSSIAPFLSKFAVEPVAQGEGIGQDLWQALLRDHPAVFWRARPDNPIVGWYTSLSDGMQRTPDWLVFWRGIEPAQIADVIAEAVARPADFSANGG